MLHIRTMTEGDLPFAVRITSKQGWSLAEDDFRFAMELEPEGCFVLLDGTERIGLATNVAYGKTAWFGNLIVNEKHRNKGAGSLLVNHSINCLTCMKVKTIGLYAYAEGIPFYTRLGFAYDSDFIVVTGKGFSTQPKPNVRPAKATEISLLIDYDEACFGASRRKLLEPIMLDHDNLTYIAHEESRIVGYAVAKVYRGIAEVGPLTCSNGRDDVAANLLEAILHRLEGVETTMIVPTKETAILNMLKKRGFKERFTVARMFHGPQTADRCICLAESLERG
jgi:GNAT superfamily N-acetyltransferase